MCNWCIWGRLGSALLAVLLLSLPACGGMTGLPDNRGGTAGPLSELDIKTLPAWQQAQFSSPGWDAPAPPPAADWLPAPAQGQVAKDTAALLAAPPRIEPRGWPGGDRAASWDDTEWDPPTPMARGEYKSVAPSGTPAYGCNNDESNSANGHAIEDVIGVSMAELPPQRITYVRRGLTVENYFNATGGMGNDALSAVYQLFSTDRTANPRDPGSTAEFGELTYRADLAPGVGPGGDCSAAQAYPVRGFFWRAFNREFTLGAGIGETQLFNMLIAPSGELSDFHLNNHGTVGRFQPFYFGTVPECYGGAWLVGLDSSFSCTKFNIMLAEHSSEIDQTFINPVLGVILKRWQQGVPPGGDAWDGALGWPVFGPLGYRGFEPQLDVRGAWRALGMYFEKGFIWWIDYDQSLYPDAADVAQCYYYTGTNVYCTGGTAEYKRWGSSVSYNEGGPLGVSVTAEHVVDEPDYVYAVAVDEPLRLHAHGFGGTPDAQWRYQYVTWRFGDGTVLPDAQAYVDDTQFVEHSYSEPGTYIVQVRVTDSLGAEAFGSALPVVVE